MAPKKSTKPKTTSKDIIGNLNQSEMLGEAPKSEKKQTQANNDQFEEDIFKLIEQYHASAKKKNVGTIEEHCQKIFDLVDQQLEERKKFNKDLITALSKITTEIEEEYNAMQENKQKLEQLTGTYIKCIEQATNACKHNFKALKEMEMSFMKQCDEMETDHRTATENLVNEFKFDIKKLEEKLAADTKRSGWESLRKSIFHAMQNNL